MDHQLNQSSVDKFWTQLKTDIEESMTKNVSSEISKSSKVSLGLTKN